jgi:hypothetical protein
MNMKKRKLSVEQGIKNLCPTWVETKLPALETTNGDPFLYTPLDTEELNSAIDNVKVESSSGLYGIN